MREILLIAITIPLAVIVLSSGIWVPLLFWLRQQRMERRFQALAAELGATREGQELVVPAFGAVVRLHVPSKSSPWVLEVTIPEPGARPVLVLGGQAILLRHETWFDRFGKRLGINREVQIGDEAFDRAVYIESNAPDAVLHGLLGDPGRRRTVLEIMEAGFSEVRVHADKSLVSASRPRPGAVHLEAKTVRDVAQRLAFLAPAIPPPEVPPDAPRVSVRRTVALWAFGIAGVSALVAAGFVLVAASDAYRPVTSDLYWVAVSISAALYAAAVFFTALVVRGKSDSLRSLVALGLLLLYDMPCYTVSAVLAINGALDFSPPARRPSVIVERWVTHGKGTSYNLRLSGLHRGESNFVMQVDPATYERLANDAQAIVTTGEGALGWEWIRGVHPARKR
jgi:hypothetical protein